jgi:hypothetical protein
MFRFVASTLVAGILATSPAFADKPNKPRIENFSDLNAYIPQHGCRQKLVRDEELATLLVTCDQEVVRSDRSLRDWLFAKELTDDEARDNKEKLTFFFDRWVAGRAMFLYYEN